MTLYDDLKWRGLIQDISSPDLIDKLNAGGMTFYIGTDPTADSLHLGHYSSFLITRRLAAAGHTPVQTPQFMQAFRPSRTRTSSISIS